MAERKIETDLNVVSKVKAVEFVENGTSLINKYVTLNTDQTIGGNKTFSHAGSVTISLLTKSSDGTTSGATSYLRAYYASSTYNNDVVLHSSGSTIIGAGESAQAIYDNNVDSIKGSEALSLSADGEIRFYSYCDTIGNRKKMTFDTSGNLNVPTSVKVNGTAVSLVGHTHTKSQITDFPTSLPANGGNADTVDNKHASDFATSTHNHDTVYAPKSHTHTKSQITDFPIIDTSVNTSSTNLVENKAVANYIVSRGENLVTNGTGLLNNNYNFSSWEFDTTDNYYCGGCFKKVGSATQFTSEFMPVNPSNYYALDYYFKASDADVYHYDFIDMYDIDKKQITANHVMWRAGSTTTLARDLNDGDTIVYLTNASGFDSTQTVTYRLGLIFWNYKNSFGYTYPTETYSRNGWENLYLNTSINKTNNTITLKSPWNKGKIPSGTPVSQSDSGGTFSYLKTGFVAAADTWERHYSVIGSVGKNNASGKFREGTAFVRIGWLLSYSNRSSTQGDKSTCITKISNVSFGINLPVASMNDGYSNTSRNSLKLNDKDPSYYLNYNNLSNKPTIPTVPGYGTTTAKIGTSSAGTATTISRSDHVHAIDLATGDSNGQVKIAGTNVSVKGLGTAAYTASTAYAAATHSHTKSQITDFPTNVSSFTNDAGYLTTHQDISGKVDKSGDTMTGDLVLKSESGDSPALKFQRGTFNTSSDSLNDWQIKVSGGLLYFQSGENNGTFNNQLILGTSTTGAVFKNTPLVGTTKVSLEGHGHTSITNAQIDTLFA